jgi:hypothetical protein
MINEGQSKQTIKISDYKSVECSCLVIFIFVSVTITFCILYQKHRATMHFTLLFFSTSIILVVVRNSLNDDQFQDQLTSVIEQLDRVELQLNNSLNALLNKMDGNTHGIIQLIKFLHGLRTAGEFSFFSQIILITFITFDFAVSLYRY